jgi:YD repeat-containing protein
MIAAESRQFVAGVAFLLLAASAYGCGGNGSSTTPTPTTTACRTYATNQSSVTNGGGASTASSEACQFSTGTNQLACTLTLSTCGAVSFTVQYGSRSDFVDEVSVIPPRMLPQSQLTAPNACGMSNGAYTYDAQNRLVTSTINAVTHIYSAWDGSGRPTIGVIVGGPAETYSYNDAARTTTLVQVTPGQVTTTVFTYDANGNLLSAVVNSGELVTTNTVQSTAQVCK